MKWISFYCWSDTTRHFRRSPWALGNCDSQIMWIAGWTYDILHRLWTKHPEWMYFYSLHQLVNDSESFNLYSVSNCLCKLCNTLVSYYVELCVACSHFHICAISFSNWVSINMSTWDWKRGCQDGRHMWIRLLQKLRFNIQRFICLLVIF